MKYMYSNLSFCPKHCPHLSLTEEEQNKQERKEKHFCKKYNKYLSHKTFHPSLVMLEECDVYDDIKKRKDYE